jgi:hypothetical protein
MAARHRPSADGSDGAHPPAPYRELQEVSCGVSTEGCDSLLTADLLSVLGNSILEMACGTFVVSNSSRAVPRLIVGLSGRLRAPEALKLIVCIPPGSYLYLIVPTFSASKRCSRASLDSSRACSQRVRLFPAFPFVGRP